MKKIFSFLKPYKKLLIIGPTFKLTEAVLEILIPTLMAMLIDNGVNAADRSYIIRMGFIMFAIVTFGVLSAYVCQYSASFASQGFSTDLRNAVFKKINDFSPADADSFGTSSLINRITGDINQLQNAVAMLIRLVIRAPFLCIGGLIMAMTIDLKLSVIFMAVIPLFVFVLFLVMFKSVPIYASVQKKLDRLTSVLRENLSGVRVIRAFAKQDHEKRRFDECNSDYAETAIRVGKISALTNPVTTIIMNLAVIAVLWLGGIRASSGKLSQGEIIAFINYLTQILNAMIIVANLIIIYTKAYTSALRVAEVLEKEPSVTDGGGADIDVNAPAVEFRDVTMSYPQSPEPSLENISFRLGVGETLGIIGATGSGKSTLASLIMRFYDADSGEVLICGANVKDYSRDKLLGKVSIVLQRDNLISGTIRDNMHLAKRDASDREIRRACDIAQASEFVDKLPDGYDTPILRSGSNFSGGQKQRLTIARALVKDTPVFIMDDSASALDFATDAALRRAIKSESAGKTVIIISQRINSVKDADNILVLDDGKCVGLGTHSELLVNCPVYEEIYRSQSE